jgi:hypothetical protein
VAAATGREGRGWRDDLAGDVGGGGNGDGVRDGRLATDKKAQMNTYSRATLPGRFQWALAERTNTFLNAVYGWRRE